jgi:hypothetical protein
VACWYKSTNADTKVQILTLTSTKVQILTPTGRTRCSTPQSSVACWYKSTNTDTKVQILQYAKELECCTNSHFFEAGLLALLSLLYRKSHRGRVQHKRVCVCVCVWPEVLYCFTSTKVQILTNSSAKKKNSVQNTAGRQAGGRALSALALLFY